MGCQPMWFVWHGRLAVFRAHKTMRTPNMGESPMLLNLKQFHGRVAHATQPKRGFRVQPV